MFNYRIVARDQREKAFRWSYAGGGELTLNIIRAVFFSTEEDAIKACIELNRLNGAEYEFKVKKHGGKK